MRILSDKLLKIDIFLSFKLGQCLMIVSLYGNHNFFLNKMLVACISFRYEYHWADGTNIKKPIKCSAPKYIDYLMTWVQDQLDDETLFPSKIGRFCFHFFPSCKRHVFLASSWCFTVWCLELLVSKDEQLSCTC